MNDDKKQASVLNLAQEWVGVRQSMLEAARELRHLDKADYLTKVWERILKCEYLARGLEARVNEPLAIDLTIKGL